MKKFIKELDKCKLEPLTERQLLVILSKYRNARYCEYCEKDIVRLLNHIAKTTKNEIN